MWWALIAIASVAFVLVNALAEETVKVAPFFR